MCTLKKTFNNCSYESPTLGDSEITMPDFYEWAAGLLGIKYNQLQGEVAVHLKLAFEQGRALGRREGAEKMAKYIKENL